MDLHRSIPRGSILRGTLPDFAVRPPLSMPRSASFPRRRPRGSTRSIAALFGGCVVALTTSRARAEHVEARLVYERAPGAESCEGPNELRAAVAERLGYDPFVERDDVLTVVVRVRGVGTGLEATIERRSPSGDPIGKPSKITSKSARCDDLLATVAVGTAIAIDPLGTGTPKEPDALPTLPPAEPYEAPRAPAPDAPAPDAKPPEPAAPSTPTFVHVGAGPFVAVGALAAASFGPRAFVGVSHGMFELDLEGRFDAPVRYYAGRQYVDSSLVLGSLLPCVRYAVFLSCASVSMGALRGTGFGYDHSREENSFYMTIGARQAFEWELGRHVALRLNVDGAIVLRPIRIEADGQVLWSTPPFAFSASPMLVGRFP